MPTNKPYPIPVYTQTHGFINAEDGSTAGATVGVDLVFQNDGVAGIRELGVSTGLLRGGKITITSGDNTKFDVAAGQGLLVDYVNEPPMVTSFSFGPFLSQVVTNIGSQPVTYIGVTLNGQGQPTIVQSSTEFTNTQRRSIVSLGLVVHSNNTSINAINTIAAVVEADANQLHDFMEAIGPLNIEGNEYGPDGANLFLDKSAGKIFKFGVAHDTTPLDPHVLAQGSGNQLTFRYRLRDSTEFADRTTIDPANWDNAGVLTAVQANRYTVQRITMFQSGLTRIQYGQAEYQTLSEAIAGFEKEVFVTEPNIKENGILRCYLVVKQSATALNDLSQAQFFPVSKFGSATGGGGSGVTSADIILALGYTPANQAVQIIAGDGLTGGGNLAADRTLNIGTPSTVTTSTTNSVTADSHTHALTIADASLTIAKTSGLQSALDGKASLTATQTFTGVNSFTREVTSVGSLCGYSFENRSGAGRWVMYSAGGQCDFFFEGAGNVFQITSVGDTYKKNANSGTMTRQPRTFVQAGDPGAAAADGDLWFF